MVIAGNMLMQKYLNFFINPNHNSIMKKRSIKIGQTITLPSNIGEYYVTDLMVAYVVQPEPELPKLIIEVIPACCYGDLDNLVTISIYAYTPAWKTNGKCYYHSLEEALTDLDNRYKLYNSADTKAEILLVRRRVILTYRLFSMYHWRMMK